MFSPVAQGTLTGKYLPHQQPPAHSRGTDPRGSQFVGRYLSNPVLGAAVQRLRLIAEELGLTLSQLAIAWVLYNPAVSSANTRASDPAQLRENAAPVGRPRTPEVLEPIDATFIDETHEGLVERDPTSSPASYMSCRLEVLGRSPEVHQTQVITECPGRASVGAPPALDNLDAIPRDRQGRPANGSRTVRPGLPTDGPVRRAPRAAFERPMLTDVELAHPRGAAA